LAILGNSSNPSSALEIKEVRSLARGVNIEVSTFEIRRADEIAPAFEALTGQVDALYVATDMLLLTNRVRINILAAAAKLPTMHGARQYVEAGGLMSYGTSYTAQFQRAADYFDKILHGARPADIPVEQPTKFELVVNLTTAKALGLTIPESLLARADEVIE
jgi:putative ABC transport system substrate-binding protein